ncbi:MAG: response regulator [Coleofasciculaceae cyanobacterium RL_1_1]|nr:response regulator [Coleofasciculaceae cyanobacterium RL_1_1]
MTLLIPQFAQPFANTLVTASRNHFSGRLAVSTDGLTWHIFFRLGRIVWIEGGVHPVRRWLRLCERYLPSVEPQMIAALHRDVATSEAWPYEALCMALQKHLTSREQLQAAIMDVAMEAMFDILQTAQHSDLTYICFAEEAPSQSLALLKVKDVFGHALRQWEAWNQIELGDYSPNLAPSIVSIERLREIVSPQAAHRLSHMAQGDRSLRDLAVTLDRDLLRLSRSLLGGVRQGAIALLEIKDCELPVAVQQTVSSLQASDFVVSTPEGLVSSPPTLTAPQTHPPTRSPGSSPSSTISATPVAPSSFENTQDSDRTSPTVAFDFVDADEMLANSQKPTIIHIDDSPQNCGIARSILEAAGYRYLDINDPLQAIPTLLQAKPELVLLDLMMPVINGYELCSQIRRVSSLKDLPIVMLTSQDGIVDRVRAKVVKASAFLSKPIEPSKLLQTVNQFIPLKKPAS